jgi:signal transduction histidine kinase
MNAVQAMTAPGTITLTTQARDYSVEIIIADTGPGVEEGKQEKIFEPFYTTKPEGEGTGLGLYLCRKIAVEHGGVLHFESKPGQGSQFILRLPIRGH